MKRKANEEYSGRLVERDELVELRREAEVGSRFKNADLATAARLHVPRL